MLHRFVISLFCATLVPAVLAIAAVEFSRLGHTELSSAAIAHENTLYLAAGVAPLPVASPWGPPYVDSPRRDGTGATTTSVVGSW